MRKLRAPVSGATLGEATAFAAPETGAGSLFLGASLRPCGSARDSLIATRFWKARLRRLPTTNGTRIHE